MSLFVCSQCGNIENTALSGYWFRRDKKIKLCSECDPQFKKGWHNKFPREKFDPEKWEEEDYNSDFIKLKSEKR